MDSITPIDFVDKDKPPVKWKGRLAGSSDLGVLRKIGINWSKETLWLWD
jgi:hypothetical protein